MTSVLAVVFAVAASAVAGGWFGTTALATQDRVPEHYRAFTAALAAIESQYAEEVESDRLVYGAINGMLQTLDPHSSFMDPRSYAQMRERQEGRYYGLGVTIQAPNGDITAVRVFEGLAGPRQGHPARRRDRRDRRAEHQGLDHRRCGGQAARQEGDLRQHRHPPQGTRRR